MEYFLNFTARMLKELNTDSSVRVWEYLDPQHDCDAACGLQWFNPLTEADVVLTVPQDMMYDICDGEATVLLPCYTWDGIQKKWWPSAFLEGERDCTDEELTYVFGRTVRQAYGDFMGYVIEQRTKYLDGLMRQAKKAGVTRESIDEWIKVQGD